ncbi:MAG: hypothetical protein H6741_35400 [Alphaproteobacteria bacterium]|nr:hypothetical protein [Alphaproteobacteria bacterium]
MRWGYLGGFGLMLLACGGLGGPDSDVPRLYAGSSCEQLISCLSTAEPESLAANLQTYGPDGACWSDEAVAEGCLTACEGLLAQTEDAHPTVQDCSLSGLVWPLDEGQWTYSIQSFGRDACRHQDSESTVAWYEEEFSGELLHGQHPAFTLSVLDCALDGQGGFTCAQEDEYLIVEVTGQIQDVHLLEADFSIEALRTGCDIEYSGQYVHE